MLSFTLAGCRIRITFSCLALLAFCCLFGGSAGGAGFFLAAGLHECGHLCAMLLLGTPPRSAELSALGCRLALDPLRAPSPPARIAVSLAGPGINLAAWLLCLALGLGKSGFALGCLGLGLFHLLPVEPLDGGLILHALLALRLPEEKAARLTREASLAVLVPLAALGFWLLLSGEKNVSLLALCVYLMFYLVLGEDLFTL